MFSTVRLETDKKQFVVFPFANDIAKKSFREKVLDNIRVSEGEVKLQSRLPFLLPDERIQVTRKCRLAECNPYGISAAAGQWFY